MKRMQTPKPSFRWQAILILLPVGVLTVLGLYSLRQDRLAAEQDAKEAGAALAQRMAQAGASETFLQLRDYTIASDAWYTHHKDLGAREDSSKSGDSAWQQANPDVDLSAMPYVCLSIFPNGRSSPQLYPLSSPPPDWLLELSPQQRRLWQEEEKAEFVSNDPVAMQAAIQKFIASKPPPGARANAEFDLLLLKIRGLTAPEAVAQLTASRLSKSGELTEAGLPVGPLVCNRALELLPSHASVPDDLFRSIAEGVRYCPCILSPRLIAESERVAAPGSADFRRKVAGLKAWWKSDEIGREVLRNILEQHPSGGWTNILCWVDSRSGRFLLMSWDTHNMLWMFPEAVVDKALDNAVAKAGVSAPPYAVLGLEIGGKELALQGNHFLMASNAPSLPVLGEAVGIFGPSVGTNVYPIRVRLYLADSHVLYARQHQRTLLFGAIILASAFAALAGLVTARRAFCRQQELNELKSNFVSSVSHELRAPIASMRLLAESLERGKIAGEAKHKEYFGLLVQESRRLSMLIENILDFSRIERGSKKYEFVPSDIRALAEETVQLMRPSAAERQVELELRGNAGDGTDSFACDSLALQQALINLVDNAVKHSPPGGRVVVGLDGGERERFIWVEDKGLGIPPEEHAKIFERFYRRGSELRRETQGIGIGLTIVKHIVEAHGGRVTVRSAPGQGSRFTMSLPLK